MFGPPGRLYVYFTYGMHFCANVVTSAEGQGSAVLLRAAEPVRGLDEMARHRGLNDVLRLCSGPGRLTQALAMERSLDGADLARGTEVFVTAGEPLEPSRVMRTTRVGVRVGTDRRWRFLERGSPFVSPGRPSVPGPITGSRRS
jgi:DNA-3-methyladenine glycosylase